MYHWLLQPFEKQLLAPDSAVIHGAGAAEPVLLAVLELGFELSADAGAEQWYKTIAKLMQGRNRNSTLTCEPRASALWAVFGPGVLCF